MKHTAISFLAKLAIFFLGRRREKSKQSLLEKVEEFFHWRRRIMWNMKKNQNNIVLYCVSQTSAILNELSLFKYWKIP